MTSRDLPKAAVAGIVIVVLGLAVVGSPSAQPLTAEKDTIARCARDGAACVLFRCRIVGNQCLVVDRFFAPREAKWRQHPAYTDEKWAYYGTDIIECENDGTDCRLLHRAKSN
jgi:hypothetical protein